MNLQLKADFHAAESRVLATAQALQDAAVAGPTTVAAREFFSAIETLFKIYKRPQNWVEAGKPQEAISPTVISWLGDFAGFLAQGKIPAPIADVAGAGQKGPGPSEQYDLSIAVTYVANAKAGQITDKAPVKTVAASYGVDRRTVQGWSQIFPVLNIEGVEILPSIMQKAGERYRQAGRSQAAIRDRAKRGAMRTEPR